MDFEEIMDVSPFVAFVRRIPVCPYPRLSRLTTLTAVETGNKTI